MLNCSDHEMLMTRSWHSPKNKVTNTRTLKNICATTDKIFCKIAWIKTSVWKDFILLNIFQLLTKKHWFNYIQITVYILLFPFLVLRSFPISIHLQAWIKLGRSLESAKVPKVLKYYKGKALLQKWTYFL